ncbi:MAG: Hsp70 family protein [Deltaproteobacteria bacterium]|nr:Hsp70 family protein [Deltaproteobacteria bacterium]
MRVVGHDGHNFLGGRDIDRAIYTWVREQAPDCGLVDLESAASDDEQALVRSVLRLCEEGKIELSRADSVEIAPLEPLSFEGDDVDFAVELNRERLELLIDPLIEKAIAVCRRLLTSHELAATDLEHVVMVGGPAATPLIRKRVAAELAPIATGGFDPMTLVAEGASLQAASLNLPLEAKRTLSLSKEASVGEQESSTSLTSPAKNTAQLFLRHPSMCRDRSPFLVGRVMNPDDAHALHSISVSCGDWRSEAAEIEEDGTFLVELSLPGKLNVFTIYGKTEQGDNVKLSDTSFQISFGVSISDPPVARSA